MNNQKILAVIKFFAALYVICIMGCTSLYEKSLGINKEIIFVSKQTYNNYFVENFSYKNHKIYFPTKENYWENIQYLLNDVDYFYGITLNDSTQIDDAYLNEIKSCAGRISKIINSSEKNYNTKPTQLSTFNLYNIDGKKLDISKNKSVVFIISTKLGNEKLSTIKELCTQVENQKNPEIDYYLISVDNPKSYGIN